MNKLVFRMTLGQAPFRIFSIIHEDRERFARAYQKLILSITLMGYPVLAGCIVAAEPMFLLLYGKQWLPAVFPFQLLCAGGMMQLLRALLVAGQRSGRQHLAADRTAGHRESCWWSSARRSAAGSVV